MKLSTEFEALTLHNLSPTLAAQWDAMVAKLAESFEDESDLLGKSTRTGSITLKIKFEHVLETRRTKVTAELEGKLPGFRPLSNSVRLPRGGKRFLVEIDDAEQLGLYRNDKDPESVQ